MVLTCVVVITISTLKRRSIMLPMMDGGPVELAYVQIRTAVKALLVLLPILGLNWLCVILVPFSLGMAYVFILLNSLRVWAATYSNLKKT
nr:adhesion G-protein coupled receptor D2-like [Oncorhynchus nerka]